MTFYVYSNGLFASKASAMVAVLALMSAGIFLWRLWQLRAEVGEFRFAVYAAIALLLIGLAGNRVSVVLFYNGLIDRNAIWPAFMSIAMAGGLLWLSYLYTRDECGHRGWLAALALALVAALFG